MEFTISTFNVKKNQINTHLSEQVWRNGTIPQSWMHICINVHLVERLYFFLNTTISQKTYKQRWWRPFLSHLSSCFGVISCNHLKLVMEEKKEKLAFLWILLAFHCFAFLWDVKWSERCHVCCGEEKTSKHRIIRQGTLIIRLHFSIKSSIKQIICLLIISAFLCYPAILFY